MRYIVTTIVPGQDQDNALIEANRLMLFHGKAWFRQSVRAVDMRDAVIVKTTPKFDIVETNGYRHVTVGF